MSIGGHRQQSRRRLRTVPEARGPQPRIQGRRHDDQRQILTQIRQLPAHRERKIRIQLPLMHLVEDDPGDSGQLRIAQKPR